MAVFLGAMAVFLGAMTVVGGVTEVAVANPAPSLAYCAGVGTDFPGSLRGGGTLAPDNDIRIYWDYLQSRGYNITSSAWTGWWATGQHDLRVQWAYWASGVGWLYVTFVCYDYRTDYPGGAYHDG